MKKIIFILLILLIATPTAFSQDVFLPFLKVFSWISCDSLYTRAAVINSTLTLSGSVSGNFIADTVEANEKIYVNKNPITDQEIPSIRFYYDADSDVGDVTEKYFEITFTGNSSGNNSEINFNTDGFKYVFDRYINCSQNVSISSSQYGTVNNAGDLQLVALDNVGILCDYGNTGSDNYVWFGTDGTYAGANMVELTRITDEGYWGIGTTTPQSKMMITDTTDGAPYFILTATDSNTVVSSVAQATDTAAVYAYIETDGDGYLATVAKDGDKMEMYHTGSAGVVNSSAASMIMQLAGNPKMYLYSTNVQTVVAFRPSTDAAIDLGAETYQWADFYVADNIYLGEKGENAELSWTKQDDATATDDSLGQLTWDGNGNPNVRLRSAVGNSSWYGVESVSTTDGTATTIYTLATSTDVDYIIEVTFVGSQDDGTNEYYAKIAFCVSNVSGTVTEDSENDIFEDDNSAGSAADASGVVSGTDYLIQVTGIASENWNWEISYHVTSVAH